MECLHVAWFVILFSLTQGVQIFLLRSPLMIYNTSVGIQNICPRIPKYSQHCVTALDAVYSYQDGEIIEDSLSQICSEDCLQPLEKYWREVIHDIVMSAYIRKTLCKKTARGYCTQQFILSSSQNLTEEVDKDCIMRWCPIACKPFKDRLEYLECCIDVLSGKNMPQQVDSVELYRLVTKSENIVLRQYDYCGQLLMRFQSDGKCLNIIELIDFIMKLVHLEEDLVNNKGNQEILKNGLKEYCESDCLQIVASYYTACAAVEEAIHQIFLFKALYCSKDGGDFCLVKGLEKMELGDVSRFKLRIYCIAPQFSCPRETCKTTITKAKTALGCCCQNLFNIEGSPFRDLIPEFIIRFMECQIELPKMCGCSSLTTSFVAVVTMALVGTIINKYLLF